MSTIIVSLSRDRTHNHSVYSHKNSIYKKIPILHLYFNGSTSNYFAITKLWLISVYCSTGDKRSAKANNKKWHLGIVVWLSGGFVFDIHSENWLYILELFPFFFMSLMTDEPSFLFLVFYIYSVLSFRFWQLFPLILWAKFFYT